MLIGRITFWVSLCGLVCQFAALALNTWQTAPGGVTMGLFSICSLGSCHDSEWPGGWAEGAGRRCAHLLLRIAAITDVVWRKGARLGRRHSPSNVVAFGP